MSHSVQDKIVTFGTLQDGWHFGEGKRIEGFLIIYALDLMNAVINEGYEILDAFPGLNGEIKICAYCSDHYHSFTINGIDNIDYEHEIGKKEIEYAERLTLNEVINKVRSDH